MTEPNTNLKGNVAIPDLVPGEECWIIVSIAAVRSGRTKQGKSYFDAIAQNSTGRIAVKIWNEAIKSWGKLYPGLWGLVGHKTIFNDDAQFDVSEYRLIDLEKYLKHHKADPPCPLAYTLDIETLPLPGFRERAQHLLKKSFQSLKMKPDQCQRYLEDQSAEELRAYKLGSLSATSGRILCIALHIAPIPDFNIEEMTPSEKVFGIESDGTEVDEVSALTQFVDFISKLDRETDELVGHNIIQFDWPFIFQRCLVHGIKIPPLFDVSSYRVTGMYDTQKGWWGGGRGTVSLDDIAWAFNIPSSKTEEVDGGQVFDLYSAGRLSEIREYNLNDVRLTRQVYERMINVLGR